MKEILLTQGLVAKVDDEDYEWLVQWDWYARMDSRRGTFDAARNAKQEDEDQGVHGTILMHRAIVHAELGEHVDHVNFDTLDNQRHNLRCCTPAQNKSNGKLYRINKTGFKGVSPSCWGNKWVAHIRKGKLIHLGTFERKEDAARAYDDAARKLFGEFAALNYPQEGERGCRN